MINQELPESWVVNRLGDFVLYQKGKKPTSLAKIQTESHNIAYVNIKAFERGVIDEYTDGEGCVLCEDNDFLMVWDGSRSGYVGRAIKGALGSTLVRIYFPGVNLDYGYFFLQSKFLEINSRAKGTGIPHVDPDLLWNYSFPLPPLAEQHRIVAKIEELFSQLDNGIETLNKAKQQLKIYRQSVLKYAFEGKLTNPGVKDGELPDGWVIQRVNDIGKVINGDRGGNYPSRSHYVSSGIPFISAGNISDNRINLSSLNFITKEKFDTLRSGKIQQGDIVYCLRGSLGKSAIIDLPEAGIASSLCILRLQGDYLPKYVHYFLCSPIAESEIMRYDNGTAQPNLSSKSFENFELPVCNIENQHEVIQFIESRLSVCDKIEESIEQGLRQAESLRQSILKKAFEGKLVPQDARDENASILLERIKAERAQAQPLKKVKTKKIK